MDMVKWSNALRLVQRYAYSTFSPRTMMMRTTGKCFQARRFSGEAPGGKRPIVANGKNKGKKFERRQPMRPKQEDQEIIEAAVYGRHSVRSAIAFGARRIDRLWIHDTKALQLLRACNDIQRASKQHRSVVSNRRADGTNNDSDMSQRRRQLAFQASIEKASSVAEAIKQSLSTVLDVSGGARGTQSVQMSKTEKLSLRQAADLLVGEGQIGAVVLEAARRGVRIALCPRGDLQRTAQGRPHQGVMLEAHQLELPLWQDLVRSAKLATSGTSAAKASGMTRGGPVAPSWWASHASAAPPLVIVADGVQDPQNLGSILRSALFLGADGVVVSEGTCAPLRAAACRAAAGAADAWAASGRLIRAKGLPSVLNDARAAGWRVLVADAADDDTGPGEGDGDGDGDGQGGDGNGKPVDGEVEIEGQGEVEGDHDREGSLPSCSIWELCRDRPTMLVLGNEGEGVRHSLRREASASVGIPRVLPAGMLASMARKESGEEVAVPQLAGMPPPRAMAAQVQRLSVATESLNVAAAASLLIGRLGAWDGRIGQAVPGVKTGVEAVSEPTQQER